MISVSTVICHSDSNSTSNGTSNGESETPGGNDFFPVSSRSSFSATSTRRPSESGSSFERKVKGLADDSNGFEDSQSSFISGVDLETTISPTQLASNNSHDLLSATITTTTTLALPPLAIAPSVHLPTQPSASAVEQSFTAPSSFSSPSPSPYSGDGTPIKPFLVEFLPGDLSNPYNWSRSYKWLLTAIIALATFGISFASSSYSAGIRDITREFGATEEQGIAGLSLYVLGFGLGPLIWAPLSEMIGRRHAFNLSYPSFVLFNIAGAVSHNIETMLVVRFLAGTFGSALLTNGMGQVGDLWEGPERPLASSLFCLAPFLGPVLGPVIGGFIVEHLSWRWLFGVQSVYASIMLILTILIVPETYPPTLLRRKALALVIEANHLPLPSRAPYMASTTSSQVELEAEAESKAKGSSNGPCYISKYDIVKRTKWEIVKVGMSRPFEMMFRELIVISLGMYAAIVYATLYLFFTAFPIVFQQARGWSTGLSGLAFLGIGLGLILGVIINPLGNIPYTRAQSRIDSHSQSRDADAEKAHPSTNSTPNSSSSSSSSRPPPEVRLYMTCLGATLLPIGLFIFAWTSPPPIHYIVPILSSVPFGTGFLLIFTGVQVYIVDSYGVYAASALAANAVQRGVLATVFPLFSVRLYEKLGLQWAGTLLAFLALFCTPLPFIFLKYGHRIRRHSKYIPSDDAPPPSQGSASVRPATAGSNENDGTKADASVGEETKLPITSSKLDNESGADDGGEETHLDDVPELMVRRGEVMV